MFDIYYESEDFKLDAPEDVVTSILEYGEKKLNMNGNFSLSFVDSQEIQSLNRDYRAKDEVTDILTFSQEDGEEFPSFTDEKEYGDVFINLDRMKENAHEFSSSEREEMLILQEQLLASYLKL